VQTSINPQKFAIFASRPEAVTEAYVAFLRNKIRTDLGMDKIPVALEIKASHASSVYEAPSRAARVRQSERPTAPKAPSARASTKKAGSASGKPARVDARKGTRSSSARPESEKEIRALSKKGTRAAPKKGQAARKASRAPTKGRAPSKNPDSKWNVAAKRAASSKGPRASAKVTRAPSHSKAQRRREK
jgi:hypothetical protein